MARHAILAAALALASCAALRAAEPAAEPALAPAAPAARAEAAAYDAPGFTAHLADGRLWVFRAESAELAAFLRGEEPAAFVVRPGAGPDGRAVRAPDSETIAAYLAALTAR